VQAVVNELYDEKIDIVRWNADMGIFIGEALSPAKAVKVTVNEEAKSAFVVVPDNQLSLAIGKAGQNVRLAARLTGWRIDIRSEAQVARAVLMAMTETAGDEDEGEDAGPVTIGSGPKAPSGEAKILIGASEGNGSGRPGHENGDVDETAASEDLLLHAPTAGAEETGVA